MRITALVGNPRDGSRTLTVAVRAARAVLAKVDGLNGDLGAVGNGAVPEGDDRLEVVDLAGLARGLFAPEPSPGVEVALDLVRESDVLVVASPTYKGTYTGVLKAFLDRLPHRALTGRTALPLLVMGDPAHSLAVEVHLRPLLVELGAVVPTPGLAVLESQIPEIDEVLDRWAAQVAPQLPRPREVVA